MTHTFLHPDGINRGKTFASLPPLFLLPVFIIEVNRRGLIGGWKEFQASFSASSLELRAVTRYSAFHLRYPCPIRSQPETLFLYLTTGHRHGSFSYLMLCNREKKALELFHENLNQLGKSSAFKRTSCHEDLDSDNSRRSPGVPFTTDPAV